MQQYQDTYEGSHRIGCEEVEILHVETNSRYIKLKECPHMAYMTDLISQPILELSIIWIELINKEDCKS
jgi:hypothetical protein